MTYQIKIDENMMKDITDVVVNTDKRLSEVVNELLRYGLLHIYGVEGIK